MSGKTMRKTLPLLVIWMSVVLPVSAQPVRETVQVTVVEVPVTVSDRSGEPIRGLTKDDFELFDEGDRKEITYFETIDLAGLQADPETPLPPAASRNFLLLFDFTHSSPITIGRAREAAKEFVTSHLGARDLASVATFSVEQGIRMLTAFTRNQQLLTDAIDTLGHPNYYRVADPLFISAQTTGTAAVDASGGGGGERSLVNEAIEETVEEFARAEQQANTEYKRNRLKTQLAHFGNFARILDRLKGQKQVILLSEGFDASLLHGREEIGGQATSAEADAGFSGEVWTIDSDQRFGNTTSSRDLEAMTDLFRRSDVTLHAIDIKGIRTNVDAREGFRRSSNEGLFLLSDPTGGTVFKNVNNLQQNFAEMMGQQEVIYLLGFHAETDNPGEFHDLDVKVKGVRGARLDHRSGYYEPTKLVPIEQTITAASVLLNDIPQEEIELQMVAAPFPIDAQRVQVPVVLEIGGRDLIAGMTSGTVNGEIFIYAFDTSDAVRSFNHQKIALDLDQVGDRLTEEGIRYYGTLLLPPGDYEIKSLVRIEETNRMGFVREDLTVPDFAAPTVTKPLIFGGGGDWLMLRDEGLAAIEYPFVVGGESFIPRVERTLSPNENYRMALFTYNVPPEKLGLAAVVRPETGASQPAKISLVGRTPQDDKGGVKYLFEFDPENLAAGSYDLEIMVNPEGGGPITTSIPFIVR